MADEKQSITISELSAYEYKRQLLSDDLFVFSQSKTGTPSTVGDLGGRYPVTGISTDHISRPVSYKTIEESLSASLSIGEMAAELDALSAKATLLDALSAENRWVKRVNDITDDLLSTLTEDVLRHHAEDWPDYLQELGHTLNGVYKNPRYVVAVHEMSGMVDRVGVNDLSSGVRDVFNNNQVSTIVSALAARVTKSVNDESYISAITDAGGRVQTAAPASLSAMIRRIFSRIPLSTLIPEIDNYRGKAYFRNYTPYSKTGAAGSGFLTEGSRQVFTEDDHGIKREEM